ncbi:hypothetical protein RclHR1_06600008 [Rhizophagus clarus]|uniref:HMG box domain-containing protein n=1 Tax=Rhizophagus clarus TaxID=94130 RepID=A0A2Z6RTI8_9GLOM|nr:hypothetical protein RclHR1_06600008 [Rhizophagus clarus]GES98445.1 hypothetical protein GLOIN_2v1769791 [Rhizophagus clarus]
MEHLHPLENDCFLYYLANNIKDIDYCKLYNDSSYLQDLYDKFFDHLILEHFRPKFPPEINEEEYTNENENNKKIKDLSKMNKGNGFIVYRKHLNKHLEASNERISMQQLSPLASALWKSEPACVKDHYKGISENIKKLHEKRLHDQLPETYDKEKMDFKSFQNITRKNGGNSFMIFRIKLNERLKLVGYQLPMQKLSYIASHYWRQQPESIKSLFKKLSDQRKVINNKQIKDLFFKSCDNDSEPITNDVEIDINNFFADFDFSDLAFLLPDNDALANDAQGSCWAEESKQCNNNDYIKQYINDNSWELKQYDNDNSWESKQFNNDFSWDLKQYNNNENSHWMGQHVEFSWMGGSNDNGTPTNNGFYLKPDMEMEIEEDLFNEF